MGRGSTLRLFIEMQIVVAFLETNLAISVDVYCGISKVPTTAYHAL